MELREDNNGFVNFPLSGDFTRQTGRTMVYLVAFDVSDMTDNPYVLSNIVLNTGGNFVSDDVNSRINNDQIYFNDISIPLTSCICIGWIDSVFKFNQSRNEKNGWFVTFRDLSNDGKNLYYSMRKLHNNKEVRILTFNF